jgi:hypothetical protein
MSDSKFEKLQHLIKEIASNFITLEEKKKSRCWKGYKPVPGKEPYSEGSCEKVSESAYRSLSRVTDHVKDRNVGIISANRKERKPAENLSNRKALEKDIKDAGYGFIRVKGGWVEAQKDGSKAPVTEPSLIVVGPKGDDGSKLKDFLKHHGSKYDQDAVVYKQHDHPHVNTISTSDRDPSSPRHTETNIGKYSPGKFGDYFTALHGDAHTTKKRKEMTPEERKAHKEASLKQKTFVFESCQFEFSEDEDSPVKSVNQLTLYGRMAAAAREKNKEK